MQWSIILALAFALVISAFAVVNMDTITVNFLFGETSIPLVLVIIGATLAGAIIVASFNIANQVSSYRKIKRLEEEVGILEEKLVEASRTVTADKGRKENASDSVDDKWDQLGARYETYADVDDDNYKDTVQIEMEEHDEIETEATVIMDESEHTKEGHSKK